MENSGINSFESSPIKGLSLNELDLAVQSTKDDDDNPSPAVQIQNESNPIIQFEFVIPDEAQKNCQIQFELFKKEMPSVVSKIIAYSRGTQVQGLLSASTV
jgi:hypothetical protein